MEAYTCQGMAWRRYVSGRPLAALILHIRDGRIRTIYAVGNPDKLQALPVAE
jgi:hypothetical protein